MSSAERAAKLITDVENREIRILNAIEIGMIKHQFVPIEELLNFTGFDSAELEYWLKELNYKELIYRQMEPFEGYILNYSGYDLLALNALVKSGVLEALGRPIGVGKEADVLEALTPERDLVAVKFHRLGRTSFRDTKRKRDYLADHQHTSWLYQSRQAAEEEFRALEITYKAGVDVPKPIDHNRHAIVLEYIDGYELVEVDEIDDPEGFLDDILWNVKKAYDAGIIHTDLSEFNVLLTKDGEVRLIDWPQFIHREHPNSKDILKRDVRNIINFFKRKYYVDRELESIINYILNNRG